MSDVAAIRDLIAGVNAAWTSVEPVAGATHLRSVFAADMVIRGDRGAVIVAQGRDACVASYVDFALAVTVHEFTSDDPEVDVFGDVALATFAWTIDYTLDFKRRRERGRDVFALRRDAGGWIAMWRAVLAADPE